LSAASVAEAQDDRYLLLATERTGTMQKEIDEAAARLSGRDCQSG
jgi:hypothetical protein